MKKFPLFFNYTDLVQGNGFVACVEINGRALLLEGAEEAWMCGVNPGGIAGGGETRKEALGDFREGYHSVLFDIATDALGFDAFRAEALEFFKDTNGPRRMEWDAAVKKVREGSLEADWLTRVPESQMSLGIKVVEVRQAEAQHNHLPQEALAA